MAYNSSDGIITAPVSISDVQSALGVSSTDLGTLCTSENINIWAKYKPVSKNAISNMSEWDAAKNQWKEEATWFQGSGNAVCGLLPYIVNNNFNTVREQTTGGMNGWTYQRPSGGSSSPYRLTDFAGYNHKAVAAVAAFGGTTKTAKGHAFAAAAAIAMGGTDNVAISDFKTQMYFGVAICNSSGTVLYHGTSSGTGYADVRFNITDMNQGTYTVVPFFCGDEIAPQIGAISGSHTFWTVPNVSTYELQIVSDTALTGIEPDGVWDKARTTLTITISSKNALNTYTGEIYVRRAGRTWANAAYSDERNSGEITLTKGSTVPVTRVFTGMDTATYNYRAQLRLSSGELFEIPIRESISPEPLFD